MLLVGVYLLLCSWWYLKRKALCSSRTLNVLRKNNMKLQMCCVTYVHAKNCYSKNTLQKEIYVEWVDELVRMFLKKNRRKLRFWVHPPHSQEKAEQGEFHGWRSWSCITTAFIHISECRRGSLSSCWQSSVHIWGGRRKSRELKV